MNKLFKGLIAGTLALSCVSPIAMGQEDNKNVAEASKENEQKTDNPYSFGNCFKHNLMVKATTGAALAGGMGTIVGGLHWFGLI